MTNTMPLDCPTCGGPLIILGRLGFLDWYRCRNCGAEVRIDSRERTQRSPRLEEPPLHAHPRRLPDEGDRMTKRNYTEAAVSEVGGVYLITRIENPDDEYAVGQDLSHDGWVQWAGDDKMEFSTRNEADRALRTYQLGFEDAVSRATVSFLGEGA